jgi:hypothetical protein
MTRAITDQQLGAYIDGAADKTLQAKIDLALQHDEALVRRMAALAGVGGMLQAALDYELGAVPARLEQIASGQVAVAAFGRPRSQQARLRHWHGYAALAATLCIALLVGGTTVWHMQAGSRATLAEAGPTGLRPGIDLASALSNSYSGAATPTPLGNVVVELSFRASQGELCRAFHVDSAASPVQGVACMAPGGWVIKALTTSQPVAASGYTTASGPGNGAVDAVIDKLGVTTVLDHADEVAAVQSAWRP